MTKNKTERDALKEIILVNEPGTRSTKTSIVFDGRQYSVRIPRKFIDALKINATKDKFEFELVIHPLGSKKPSELRGHLVRGK